VPADARRRAGTVSGMAGLLVLVACAAAVAAGLVIAHGDGAIALILLAVALVAAFASRTLANRAD
jgi:hypothetical protein